MDFLLPEVGEIGEEYFSAFDDTSALINTIERQQQDLQNTNIQDINPIYKIPAFQKVLSANNRYIVHRSLARMDIFTTTSIIVLVGGLLFSLTHAYFGFRRPLSVLITYCNNAFM